MPVVVGSLCKLGLNDINASKTIEGRYIHTMEFLCFIGHLNQILFLMHPQGVSYVFVITWILHQIIMFSNKVSKNNDPPIHLFTPSPSLLLYKLTWPISI